MTVVVLDKLPPLAQVTESQRLLANADMMAFVYGKRSRSTFARYGNYTLGREAQDLGAIATFWSAIA